MATVDTTGRIATTVYLDQLTVYRNGQPIGAVDGIDSSIAAALRNDGKEVAFVKKDQIWVAPIAEKLGPAKEVTQFDFTWSLGSKLAYSPDGETVAALSGYLYHWSLHLVSLDSGFILPTAIADRDGGYQRFVWDPVTKLLIGMNGDLEILTPAGKQRIPGGIKKNGYGPVVLHPHQESWWSLYQSTKLGFQSVARSGEIAVVPWFDPFSRPATDELQRTFADLGGRWVLRAGRPDELVIEWSLPESRRVTGPTPYRLEQSVGHWNRSYASVYCEPAGKFIVVRGSRDFAVHSTELPPEINWNGPQPKGGGTSGGGD